MTLKELQTTIDDGVDYARKHDVICKAGKSQFIFIHSNVSSHKKCVPLTSMGICFNISMRPLILSNKLEGLLSAYKNGWSRHFIA